MREIRIGNRILGERSPAFIIAEAGVNHNGDPERARALIKEAAACGADCIKFQTFKAERVVTKKAPKARYQLETTDRVESQLEMLEKLELKPEDHKDLKASAERMGLVFLSTPYNLEDIDLLEDIGVLAYKAASIHIVEHPFLRKMGKTGKPIFLSTGMSTLSEVDRALRTLHQAGNLDIILLQCTTDYPARIEDANLRAIETLRSTFHVLTGYSDHTIGDEAPVAAIALGAKVLEKHFTLDKDLPGPDHSSSLTPPELKSLVEKVRRVEKALGDGLKKPSTVEIENAVGMRRGLTASSDIPKGEEITAGKITFKRPAKGLFPDFYDMILGQRAARDISADEQIEMDAIEWRKRS